MGPGFPEFEKISRSSRSCAGVQTGGRCTATGACIDVDETPHVRRGEARNSRGADPNSVGQSIASVASNVPCRRASRLSSPWRGILYRATDWS